MTCINSPVASIRISSALCLWWKFENSFSNTIQTVTKRQPRKKNNIERTQRYKTNNINIKTKFEQKNQSAEKKALYTTG